jgi:hypothetical protein
MYDHSMHPLVSELSGIQVRMYGNTRCQGKCVFLQQHHWITFYECDTLVANGTVSSTPITNVTEDTAAKQKLLPNVHRSYGTNLLFTLGYMWRMTIHDHPPTDQLRETSRSKSGFPAGTSYPEWGPDGCHPIPNLKQTNIQAEIDGCHVKQRKPL